MHWIPDPRPSPPHRTGMDYSDPLVQPSDPPVPIPSDLACPRNAPVKSHNTSDTQASAIATSAPSGAPLTSPLPRKYRRRRRRKARIYPLTVSYNECLVSRSNPLSFTNLRVVDLRNGQSQYLSTMKQLMDPLPKTEDPSSCFALQGHIASLGQKRLRRSMRAALWWLLPSARPESSATRPTPSSTS